MGNHSLKMSIQRSERRMVNMRTCWGDLEVKGSSYKNIYGIWKHNTCLLIIGFLLCNQATGPRYGSLFQLDVAICRAMVRGEPSYSLCGTSTEPVRRCLIIVAPGPVRVIGHCERWGNNGWGNKTALVAAVLLRSNDLSVNAASSVEAPAMIKQWRFGYGAIVGCVGAFTKSRQSNSSKQEMIWRKKENETQRRNSWRVLWNIWWKTKQISYGELFRYSFFLWTLRRERTRCEGDNRRICWSRRTANQKRRTTSNSCRLLKRKDERTKEEGGGAGRWGFTLNTLPAATTSSSDREVQGSRKSMTPGFDLVNEGYRWQQQFEKRTKPHSTTGIISRAASKVS